MKKAAEQLALVETFRKGLEKSVLYVEYDNESTFSDAFGSDLRSWLTDSSRPWVKERTNRVSSVESHEKIVSQHPAIQRSQADIPLIGRQDDVAWLKETESDCLIYGQPGMGKTHLLQELTKDGAALFAICDDGTKVFDAIETEQLTAIIIDDAHAKQSLVTELSRLRREHDAHFRIIASCWPTNKDDLKTLMGLPSESVRELEPLSRSDMFQILKSLDIERPEALVASILNQAEGKPGLAVTLGNLWLRGDRRDVVDGNALVRLVSSAFKDLVGANAMTLLATFSVGGRAGMSIERVAEVLGLPEINVQNTVIELSAGGVVSDIDGSHLMVSPAELRAALIRDVFFSGANSLSFERFAGVAPDKEQTTMAAIEASYFGASIPDKLLAGMLQKTQSEDVWEAYSKLGHAQAKHAIELHPEMLNALAPAGLHHIPEIVIPMILNAAVDAEHSRYSFRDKPMKTIDVWIQSGKLGTAEPLRRRSALLNAVRIWRLEKQGDSSVAVRAIRNVLRPNMNYSEADRVTENRIKMAWGVLSSEELDQVADLWSQASDILESVETSELHHIVEAIRDWAYPGRHARGDERIIASVAGIMRSVAEGMLKDMKTIGGGRPGLNHQLTQISRHLNLTIDFELDDELEVLFPVIPHSDRQETREKQGDAIRDLADKWMNLDPFDRVDRILQIEKEASSVELKNRQTTRLCEHLAQLVNKPDRWIKAIVEKQAGGDLTIPFLGKMIANEHDDWEDWAVKLLNYDGAQMGVISFVVTMLDPPEHVWQVVSEQLCESLGPVEYFCAQDAVPQTTLKLLLTHTNESVAGHAAIGLWQAEPKQQVPEHLKDDWRNAVLQFDGSDYWLCEILQQNHELAYEWLLRQLPDVNKHWPQPHGPMEEALNTLSHDQRREVMQRLPEKTWGEEFINGLIGDDLTLYELLLASKKLKRCHLIPLQIRPDEHQWVGKVQAALKAGYTPEEIARVTISMPLSWQGNESDMWNGWIKAYEAVNSSDPGVLRVVERDLEFAHTRRDQAIEEERRARLR